MSAADVHGQTQPPFDRRTDVAPAPDATETDESGSWSTVPAAIGKVPVAAPRRGPWLYFPRLR